MLFTVVMKRDDKNGIDERSHRFYVDVLAFVDTIPAGPKTKKLIEQLAGAAGSIGGNREEALGGSSRKEFIRFMKSHCGEQTSQRAGSEPVRRENSVSSSSVPRCSMRPVSWQRSWAGLS